jgi:hypothetical protein
VVYDATLDALFGADPVNTILVSSRTKAGITRERLVPQYWTTLEHLLGLQSSTFRSFEKENRAPAAIPNFKPKRVDVELVDDSVRENVAALPLVGDTTEYMSGATRYWRKFSQRFPKVLGVATFTRIGYSEDGTQALVLIDFSCGAMCGEGNIVMLRKADSVWRVVLKRRTWES